MIFEPEEPDKKSIIIYAIYIKFKNRQKKKNHPEHPAGSPLHASGKSNCSKGQGDFCLMLCGFVYPEYSMTLCSALKNNYLFICMDVFICVYVLCAFLGPERLELSQI